MEKRTVPSGAVQGLATVRSLTLQLDQHEVSMRQIRTERQRLLFNANRLGATYEVIVAETGLAPSTVATEIAAYRDSHGMANLPRGRRRGISPKSKAAAARVA